MSTSTTTTKAASAPKITLYTNHACPWAHRAHVAIKEIGLPYEEVIIDLSTPREQWYLDINPRGQVPALRYKSDDVDETFRESAVVAQFLADAHPSHLQPADNSPAAAAHRARVALFVDTFFTKVNSYGFSIMADKDETTREEKVKELVNAVEKEIEPLLEGANPFFGGASELTMAEVQTASFVLRYYDFADGGVFPKSLAESLDKVPRFSKWAHATRTHPSVTYIWNKDAMTTGARARLEKLRAS